MAKSTASENGTSQVQMTGAPQGVSKIDQLIEILSKLADAEGYFTPPDLYSEIRNTDLEKSASIILSNLRYQQFGKDGKFRAPLYESPAVAKKFINVVAALRKENRRMSYDETVESAKTKVEGGRGRPADKAMPKEKAPTPPAAKAPTKIKRKEAVHAESPKVETPKAQPEPKQDSLDYEGLYREANERALKLEAELGAYKNMCFDLISVFKK